MAVEGGGDVVLAKEVQRGMRRAVDKVRRIVGLLASEAELRVEADDLQRLVEILLP